MSAPVVVNQPGVYLVDEDGNVITLADGTAIGTAEGILVMGKDGANGRIMRVAADGTVRVDPTGTTTQPVSVASLPLPAGAATEATLASIDGKEFATQTTLAALLSAFNSEDFATQTTLASLLSAFNAEDFASETTLASLNGKDFATQTTLAALLAAFSAEDFATATNQTDGSQKTQVVGGGNTLGINVSGQAAIQNPPNLNVAASTLATAANQTNGNQKSIVRSGAKGTSAAADITSTPYDANTEALHIDIVDSAASRLASKLIVAGYHAAALAATTYILMIDLSDGDGGDYKHVGSSSIKLTTVTGSLVKSSIGSQWRSIVGIIMAIDATEATIHWLDAATLFALDTSTVEQHKATIVPSVLDLEVSGGAMVNSSGGYDEAGVTAVNTTGTLNNVVGNAKTPAVGDMVLRVTQNSGGGTAETAYSVRYLVD
jgi:hypothetical protein